jgi:hypothetical protein
MWSKLAREQTARVVWGPIALLSPVNFRYFTVPGRDSDQRRRIHLVSPAFVSAGFPTPTSVELGR